MAGGEVGRQRDGGPELPRLEPALGGEVRGEDGRQVGAEEGHQVDVLQPGSGRHRHLQPPDPRLVQHHGPAAWLGPSPPPAATRPAPPATPRPCCARSAPARPAVLAPAAAPATPPTRGPAGSRSPPPPAEAARPGCSP